MEDVSCEVVKSKDVIGKKVFGNDNENLGKIEEVVLDKIGGQVRYVVLSFGGFLGLGDTLYAMPWKSISYDSEKDGFRLMFNKEKLRAAPSFSKDHWPNFADDTFNKNISNYYF